ncbi:MAG: BON domain-containing protein [Thermomicrobiales bacterium]
MLERLDTLESGAKKRGRGGKFWFRHLLGGASARRRSTCSIGGRGSAAEEVLGAAGGGADAAAQRDQEINARVEADVFRDSSVPKNQININTVDGVVYIRGTVASQQAISDIEERAKKVSGVDAVINLLAAPAPASRADQRGLDEGAHRPVRPLAIRLGLDLDPTRMSTFSCASARIAAVRLVCR